ncbi:MAG: hypothetical protein ACR2P0_11950 [Acidimicrobiales bacterium]
MSTSKSAGDGPKRKRLSAEETRDRTCEAGVNLIGDHGLALGLDTINLEQAIKAADVSRSSAYAAWSTDENYSPQELFQRTVLKQAVIDRRLTIERTQAAALEVVESRGATLSPAELFRELSRVTGGVNARSVAESRSWQLVVALRSVLNSAPAGERDNDLADWMSESEKEFREETIETVYRPFIELLGLRPKAEYGDDAYHLGEIAAAALAEGLAPRYFMETERWLDGIERTTSGGESQNWSLFSIVFEQIALTFFEPIDPEAWAGR